MAAVWAETCAEEILNEWGSTPGLRMKDLIADALDVAEEKGYERGYATRDEELAEIEVDPKVIRSACIAAAKHPMGGAQKEPHCSYPNCETNQQDSHYPCNCPVAIRAAFEALVTRSSVGG